MEKFVRFDFVSYEESKKFKMHEQNRAVKHSHLEKIKKQCKEHFDIIPPIMVNILTMMLIDGQHRILAIQKLIEDGILTADSLIKVMFVEIPVDQEVEAIINANINSKSWALDDYIARYAKAGVEAYTKLDSWCKSHALAFDNGKSKFRYGAAIITGKGCAKELKVGSFSITDKELEEADAIHAEMLEIVQLFNLRGRGAWIEALAISWHTARKQHDFKTWIKELKSKKRRFSKLPKENSKDWNNIFAQTHYIIDAKSK